MSETSREYPPNRVRALYVSAGLLLAPIIAAWFVTSALARLGEEQAREHVQKMASSVAASLEPQHVAALTGVPEDQNKEAYRHLRDQLARIQDTDSTLRFVYLMGLRDEGVIFLADAEPPNSDDYSAPGDPYDEASPALVQAFQTGESLVEGPLQDQWGEWVSGHKAILDPETGAVFALVGIDIDAKVWRSEMAPYRFLGLCLTGFLILTGLGLTVHLYRVQLLNRHLRKEVARRTRGEGDLRQEGENLALRERELRSLVNNTPDVIYQLDGDGKVMFINDAIRGYGFVPKDIIGHDILEFVHPDDREKAECHIKERRTGVRSTRKLELRMFAADSTVVPAELHSVAVEESKSFLVSAEGLYRSEKPQPETFVGTQGVARDITERRRAEARLQESKRHYLAILENITDVVSVVGADGTIRYESPAVTRVLGYEPHDRVGENAFGFIHPDDRQRLMDVFKGGLEDAGGIRRVTGRFRHKDGSYRTIESTGRNLLHDPVIHGVVITGQDVTEREKAKQALRASEKRYRTLIESANDAIFIIDDGRFVECNQKTLDIFGTARECIIGQCPHQLSPPVQPDGSDSYDAVLTKINAALSGIPQFFEWQHHRGNGTLFDAEVSLSRCDDSGKICLMAVVRDVSDRKCAEKALRESEQRYRAVFNTAVDGIAILDESGYILDANHAFCRKHEYALEELDGRHWKELVHAESHASIQRVMNDLSEGDVSPLETIDIRHDGTPMPTEARLSALPLGGEKRILVILRDLTERKLAEEERTRLATAIEQAAEAILITDARGTIQYVNPAFERLTGYTREEATGENPRILRSGKHDVAFYRDMWATLERGETWSGRLTNKTKGGCLFEEEATISPVRDAKRRVTNYVAVKRDVTHEVQLETQLRQAQKMEAIGTLAGGIAHDFNNVLSAVLGYTELAMNDVQKSSAAYRSLTEVEKAGRRAAELVQQILTFSRKSEQERKPIRLGPVVKEALKLLRGSLPATIEIDQKIDGDCPPVLGDPVQIHQVIMNLCTNAFHSMEENCGTLTVALSRTDITPEYAASHINMHSGPHIRLTISDTGHGMDEDTKQRVFEPYFTTKPEGKGTGMGLATVHGIVNSHGGAIHMISEVNVGTEFTVYLPISVTEEKEKSNEGASLSRGHEERVLLIDDEHAILQANAMMLERIGYVVTAFSSPIMAYAAFREAPTDFDVVVTDQTMPMKTGTELAEELLSIRGDIPIILTTGLADRNTSDKAHRAGIGTILAKPVNLSDLSRSIQKCLAKKLNLSALPVVAR